MEEGINKIRTKRIAEEALKRMVANNELEWRQVWGQRIAHSKRQ